MGHDIIVKEVLLMVTASKGKFSYRLETENQCYPRGGGTYESVSRVRADKAFTPCLCLRQKPFISLLRPPPVRYSF